MSQGGSTIDDRSDSQAAPHAGRLLRQLIRSGHSFSGHERHCCFLNTGQLRFANVSAVSGLDLDDDGRAVGLVDWDQDGDLDLWLVNRSGPQLRLLLNDAARGDHNFIAVRLQGTQSNRDAIGARVQVVPDEPGAARQIRTLRAGDGYLSQSSKWLHFGLGRSPAIKRLIVRWPSGQSQQFDDLTANRRYLIREGEAPRVMEPVAEVGAIAGVERSEPTAGRSGAAGSPRSTPATAGPGTRGRIVLASPLPLPRFTYRSADGQPVVLPDAQPEQPLRLVNLWASWCQPCVAELQQLAARVDDLRAVQLDVIALNVDDLDAARPQAEAGGNGPDPSVWPFRAGSATDQLVEQWQLVHDNLMDLHTPLPIPCSFLLDRQGRLAAIYKGPVDVDTLLVDVGQLGRTAAERRDAALPFAGRWSADVREHRLLTIALGLLERGWLDEAREFVQAQRSELAEDVEFHILLYNLGQEFARRNDLASAQTHFEAALSRQPDFAPASYNLGVLFARSGKFEVAARHFSRAVDSQPDDADARLNLVRTLLRVGRLSDARSCLQEGLRRNPKHAAMNYELAVVQALGGAIDAAVQYYRAAVAQDGQYAGPAFQAKFREAALLAAGAAESLGPDGRAAAAAIRARLAVLPRELERESDAAVP